MLSDAAKEVFEMYTTNGMCIDAHVYHGTSAVVINDLARRFLAEKVLQKAHDSLPRSSQQRAETNLNSKPDYLRLIDGVVTFPKLWRNSITTFLA